MEGLVIKIIQEQGYVKINKEVVICSLRGRLKRDKLLPLVGDKVIINKEKKVIEKILPRKNCLRRPPVSNITKGIVIASLKKPDLDLNLIDKILVELEYNSIKPVIIFTKCDLLTEEEKSKYLDSINYYKKIYPVYFNTEIDKIKEIFKNEVSVFIGQTGAGKSTLLNNLNPHLELKTGEISEALGRGRHTTRHVEILELLDGYIFDSPGFSSLEFPNMLKEEIRDAFIEFKEFNCPFKDCMHEKEDNCSIKKAVSEGKILKSRYDNYLLFLKTASEFEYKRR